MCRLQWATLRRYLIIIIIVLVTSDDLSTFITAGTATTESCSHSNTSVCNSSVQVMPSCDCGYYSNNNTCIAYTPPVGINNNTSIPNTAMTASSSYDRLHTARQARLDSNSSAWCADDIVNASRSQYLQIDLGKAFELSRIATQGTNKDNISGYVTSYKIAYSLNANVWYTYQENRNSSDKIFPGNLDAVNVSCNELKTSQTILLVARFVRLYPITWVGHICISMELYGVPHKCLPARNTCSTNATCAVFRNTTVCWCRDGFTGDGYNCTDDDECKQLKDPCYQNTNCVNTPGSFKCVCKQGYYGNLPNCTDIDECSSNRHSCSSRAQCLNTNGSYSCQCIPGYHGNGYTCEDVNECSGKESHNCHGNATCINRHGTYTCACKNGFHGDGQNCTDVDECMWFPRVCHHHAVCLNTPGSYECRCFAGYSGDGHNNCTVIYVAVSTRSRSSLFLGIVIGIPVIALSVVIVTICVFLFTRRRRNRVTRRPRSSKVSRPSSTVIGQIDQLFDEENSKRSLRDSVSLRSLQFSIPSVHPSLVALNNIGSTPTKPTPTYETL